MTVKEQMKLTIANIMKENNVTLASDNFILNNDWGKVSFNLDVSIDISHMEEFRNNLEKLIDCDSPIADDGYAGGEISDLHGEVFFYKVLHNYIFKENRKLSLEILKENCDEKMVEDIIKKIDDLANLGFDEIKLVFSKYMNEQFINKTKEFENEITAGYYNLENDEMLKIKYKILEIK